MNDDELDHMVDILQKSYKKSVDSAWEDEYDELVGNKVSKKAMANCEMMLRQVMMDLHDQGQDTFHILKNDMLRDWWTQELAKIQRDRAKKAAREKAKDMFSKEERELLGLRF